MQIAEALRKKLLADYSTGTINFNGVLRILIEN